jgi:hypothetical protein
MVINVIEHSKKNLNTVRRRDFSPQRERRPQTLCVPATRLPQRNRGETDNQ